MLYLILQIMNDSESINTQRTLEKDQKTRSLTRVYTIYWKYHKNGNDFINDCLS